MNIILFHPEECTTSLSRSDYRAAHLLRTLRATPGRAYTAGVIGGAIGRMVIEEITEQEIRFRFIPTDTPPPPLLPITLLVGHPRPPVAKRLVADLSSMGVSEIHLFIGENSEKSYLQSRIWHEGQLAKMCIQGAEQAGTTATPPTSSPPHPHPCAAPY